MKYLAIAMLLGVTSAVQLESNDTKVGLVEDSLVQIGTPCIYLDETQQELDYQLEMFSRTLDTRFWTNALNVAKEITKAGGSPKWYVKTWELYDKAFSFPRIRRYAFVQENMDMLEHFQDNLNTNITNSQHMDNFLRVANLVRQNLNGKFVDGEFTDPANYDPRADEKSIYFKDGHYNTNAATALERALA